MSDESSDNEQVWWVPADRPEPAEPEEPADPAGRIRPIGPLNLRSWSRRPYVLTGVAVVALLGGAGAALAATNSPTPGTSPSAVVASPAPSPSPSGQAGQTGPRQHGFRHFGFGIGLGGGMFGALHGQFVVPKSGGGYQTVDMQNGQVTAVGTTSITLKSSDGFTKTYAVASSTMVDAQRDGISSVKVGNQVTVLATVSGSTATATSIGDLTLMQQNHAGFGFGRPPAPSKTPSAQTG